MRGWVTPAYLHPKKRSDTMVVISYLPPWGRPHPVRLRTRARDSMGSRARDNMGKRARNSGGSWASDSLGSRQGRALRAKPCFFLMRAYESYKKILKHFDFAERQLFWSQWAWHWPLTPCPLSTPLKCHCQTTSS